ncbi:MAG: GntR family transcriptional regulator [Desulfarculus sp.]|nr:GntR family transcriptional regulator [Desulfarculus sp.]
MKRGTGMPGSTAKDILNIDRDSFEPAYLQLVRIFKAQIASGKYRPGAKLPSEAVICKKYGLSPMTVRRAINLLIDQGVVRTVQGSGTFVRGVKLSASSFNLQELMELIQDENGTQVKVLEMDIAKASPEVAERLGLASGDNVIHARRLLLTRGHPVVYHHGHLLYDPQRPIVEGELDVTSLRGLFSGAGQTDIKKGLMSVQAVTLGEQEAGLLKREQGSPAFRLEHTFYDFDDRPVSYGWFVCPADRLLFTAKIGHWDEE